MYRVVLVDDWTSVVPNSWIEADNMCRWPPKHIKTATAIMKRIQPSDDWLALRFKQALGPFADTNFFTNNGLTNTACSSSCAINQETELFNRTKDNFNIPSGNHDNRKNKERYLQDITNNFREITEVQRKNVMNNDSTNEERAEVAQIPKECGCRGCHEKIKKIYKIICEIYAQNMNNDAGYQGRKITENDDTSLLPPMPLQTIKDFNELEALLSEEPQARRQLRIKFLRIGGNTPAKHTRNILYGSLNNQLAYQLSWSGQKNTKGISKTKFADTIIDSVIQLIPTATINEVQTVIKFWLQHAGDRIKYKGKTRN
ncbi:uncharacterized protein LOC105828374 isoform X3 [Monomorium pharaonis]|nr:uncharacterized protein LOC105828374 isoform X3 [Monomorium pharaonis]XP_028045560.1 uncharacterized protein LOC105828374 isoform X3 [Monomorium pharaonis]